MSLLKFCIVCGFVSFYNVRANNTTSLTIQEVLEKILERYNKKIRPDFDGAPVRIVTSISIVAVDNVNDVTSDFTVKMFYAETWNDSRLAYGEKRHGVVRKETLRISGDFVGDIWTPDTYVENQEANGSYKDFSSVRLSKRGTILLSRRMTVKADCPTMNLQFFPHDVQACSLLTASYAYPAEELTYEWSPRDAVVVGDSPIASQYQLDDTITEVEERHFKTSNATWTYLKLTFVLRRKIAYYIIRIYLPAILVTLTSWVSFWVDPNAIPGRLSLCVITVLAMTTLSYSSQSMVPNVPYVKAVDLYLIISFFFVFGSLLEYTILLNVNLRRQCLKRVENNEVTTAEILLNKENPGIIIEDVKNGSSAEMKRANSGKTWRYCSLWTLDNFSTVFFPFTYVFFHTVYFSILLA